MDVLVEIFLFLNRNTAKEICLVNREFREIATRTPFFQRDYLVPGSFRNWLHFTPIMICKYHLTEYLATKSNQIQKTFKLACRLGYLDMVKHILKLNKTMKYSNCGYDEPRILSWEVVALEDASKYDQSHIIDWLLENNACGINNAIRVAHLNVIDKLLRAGADPNAGLHKACQNGRWRIVKKLLDAGAQIDDRLLFGAVYH